MQPNLPLQYDNPLIQCKIDLAYPFDGNEATFEAQSKPQAIKVAENWAKTHSEHQGNIPWNTPDTSEQGKTSIHALLHDGGVLSLTMETK